VYAEPRPSVLDMTLPAFAAKRGLQAYQLSVAHLLQCRRRRSAANSRPPPLLSIGGTDELTDGRTDGRPTVRHCCLLYTVVHCCVGSGFDYVFASELILL